jgi:hypothetical protein
MAGIALLIGFVVLASGVIYLIGMHTQRKLIKNSPRSQALKKFTPTGVAWVACLVAGFTGLMAVRELAPESVLGGFLRTWYGVAAGYFVLVGLFTLAGVLLRKYGHPVSNEGRDV